MKKTCRITAAILMAAMLLPCFASAKVDQGSGSGEIKTYTGDYMLIMNRYLSAIKGSPISLKGTLSAIETASEARTASPLSNENEAYPVDLGLWMDDPSGIEYSDELSPAALAADDEPQPEQKKPGEYSVGETRDFVTYPDGNLNTPTKVSFTLVYKGVTAAEDETAVPNNCTMWVPTATVDASVKKNEGGNVTYRDAAAELGREFDEKIYPYLRDNFGAYDDMNKDGSVTFLLYDIGGSSGGAYTAGFFYGGDMNDLPSWTEGNTTFPGYVGTTNQMDIMHLNINTIPNSGIYRLKKTLAHEFVHLLVYSSYRRMGVAGVDNPATYGVLPSWINEGIAQAAEHNLYGETLSDRINEYNSGSPLYAHEMAMSYRFEGSGDEVLFRYAQSYLAVMYMQSRVAELNGTDGIELYKKIIGSSDLRVINDTTEANSANEKLYDVVGSALKDKNALSEKNIMALMRSFNVATVLERPSGAYGFGRFTEMFKNINRQPTATSVVSALDSGSKSIYAGGTVLIRLGNGSGQFDLSGFTDSKGTATLSVLGLERDIDISSGASVVFEADYISVGGRKWYYDDCVIRSSRNGVATLGGTLDDNIELECGAKVDETLAVSGTLTLNGTLTVNGTLTIASGGRIDLGEGEIVIPAGGSIVSGTSSIEGPQTIKNVEKTVARGEEAELELGYTAASVSNSATGFFADGYPKLTDGKLTVKTLDTAAGGASATVSIGVLAGLTATAKITTDRVECAVTVTATDKVYGETIEPTVTATDGGRAIALTKDDITLTYTKDGRTTEPKSVGAYTVSASVDTGGYYGTSTESAAFEITKKALTITDISAVGRRANGSTTVELRGTLNGVVEGDTVTLKMSGEIEDPAAGEDKPVSNITASLSGSAAGNYYIDENSIPTDPTDLTVTIEEAPPAPVGPVGPTGGGGGDEEEEPSAEPIAVEKDVDSGTVTTRGETSASVDVAAVADAGDTPTTRFELDGATVSASTAAIAEKLGEDGVLTVSVTSEENRDGETVHTIAVTLGEDSVSDIPLTVELDAKKLTAGSIAYIVDEDGNEQAVMQSCKSGDTFAVKLDSGAKIVIRDEAKAFEDTENHWGRESADFATSHGLFLGTSETKFSPDEPMTRGMITTVLWRLAERPGGGDSTFADVSSDMYYAEPIAWGIENGIVKGVGGDLFAPDDNVDRESVAIILYRFAELNGLVSDEDVGDLSGFADADSVSPWAQKELAWAVSVGIITGKDGNLLEPTAGATRVEVATMMWRYLRFAIAK